MADKLTRGLVFTPKQLVTLKTMGEQLKLARLRRQLTAEQVSERAGISRTTLWQVEGGQPNVAMGAYAQVLFVLRLEEDLLKLAADDELGRKLQDAKLEVKQRGRKK
jgi:transcriptional regulator with XRE-family HTH domain